MLRMFLRYLCDRVGDALSNCVGEDAAPGRGLFPTATELIAMSDIEREMWMQHSFDLAPNEEFEMFDAFGEESF